jgi:hypothetical protein
MPECRESPGSKEHCADSICCAFGTLATLQQEAETRPSRQRLKTPAFACADLSRTSFEVPPHPFGYASMIGDTKDRTKARTPRTTKPKYHAAPTRRSASSGRQARGSPLRPRRDKRLTRLANPQRRALRQTVRADGVAEYITLIRRRSAETIAVRRNAPTERSGRREHHQLGSVHSRKIGDLNGTGRPCNLLKVTGDCS